MFIKKLKVENFKSFKEIDVELGNFNVIIGANASGKTNFVKLLQFLKHLSTEELEDAISLAGGTEYFRNLKLQSDKPFSLNAVLELNFDTIYSFNLNMEGFKINEMNYLLKFIFKEEKPFFQILEENLLFKANITKYNKKTEEIKFFNTGELKYQRNKGKLNVNFSTTIPIKVEEFAPAFMKYENLPENITFFQLPGLFLFSGYGKINMDEARFYEFNPKTCKSPSKLENKIKLEEDGSNLAKKLEQILKDEEDKNKFINIMTYILDFTKDFKTEREFDGSISYNILEKYSDQYLPSIFLSDGTVNITALVIALFFEDEPLAVFEEPDRGIHPYVISRLVELMKEASAKKQIIITTHNPQILKYTDPEDLLLISRDKDGFSKITRPIENQEIRDFLENDMGLDEIYVDNLVEISNYD